MCVYITWLLETAYTILKRKQTERWTKRRNTKLGNNELLSNTAGKEERKRRRRGREGKRKKEVRRVRDRKKRQRMEEHKAERKNLKDEGCTFILYCTPSMTDLHAIVVNSFCLLNHPSLSLYSASLWDSSSMAEGETVVAGLWSERLQRVDQLCGLCV